jgi:hypothetical protein
VCELGSDEEHDACELLLLSDELCELDEESKLEELDSEVLLLSDELCTLEGDKELESKEVSEVELLKLKLRLLDSEEVGT